MTHTRGTWKAYKNIATHNIDIVAESKTGRKIIAEVLPFNAPEDNAALIVSAPALTAENEILKISLARLESEITLQNDERQRLAAKNARLRELLEKVCGLLPKRYDNLEFVRQAQRAAKGQDELPTT